MIISAAHLQCRLLPNFIFIWSRIASVVNLRSGASSMFTVMKILDSSIAHLGMISGRRLSEVNSQNFCSMIAFANSRALASTSGHVFHLPKRMSKSGLNRLIWAYMNNAHTQILLSASTLVLYFTVPHLFRSDNSESTEFRRIPIGIRVNSEIPSKFLGMSDRNSNDVNSECCQVKFRVNS
jgi:hypothetical protein